jgi:hypothetical protein
MQYEIKEIIEKLVEQQVKIFELCGDERRPKIRPPISNASLSLLKAFFIAHNSVIPPSYQAFLETCDGIENFSFSYDVFGSKELLSKNYNKLNKAIYESGTGLNREEDKDLLLIGYQVDTTTRLFIDLLHEQIDPTESIVFDGDPGDISMHSSFISFLRMRVEANNITIQQLDDVKGGLYDDVG